MVCIGKENTGHFTNLLVAGNLLRGIRGTSSLGRSQPNEEQREESLDQWFINIQCALACTDCWTWPQRVRCRRAGVGLENCHFQQVPRRCCCPHSRNHFSRKKGQIAKATKQERAWWLQRLERNLVWLESKEQGTGLIGRAVSYSEDTRTQAHTRVRFVWGGSTTGFAFAFILFDSLHSYHTLNSVSLIEPQHLPQRSYWSYSASEHAKLYISINSFNPLNDPLK